MPIGARLPVASTPAVPLPYGLWTVVVPVDNPDEGDHWRNGVTVQPDPCERARTTVDYPPPDPKQITSTLPMRGYDPVTVYARVDIGPVGRGQDWEAEVQARAAAALTLGEARAIERAFWTGDIDDSAQTLYPHLAANADVFDPSDPTLLLQSAAVVPQAGVLDVVEAVGLLEESIGACYGGVPVLHIPRSAIAALDSFGLLRSAGGKLTTLSGSLVNAGAGNQHTGPTGATPAYPNAWFYATGQITARRTAIEYPSTVRQALDKGRNELVYIAERTYVVGWDCCHFAAQVSLGGRATGQPSDPGPLP